MKRWTAIFFLLTFLWPLGCSPKEKAGMNASLAVVNKEPITVGELLALSPEEGEDREIKSQSTTEERAALHRALLDQLIERKMLLQEAKRLKIQISNAELTAKISELKAAMDEQAAANLMREGEEATLKAFEEATRTTLLIEKLLSQLPVQDPAKSRDISEEAIQDYYEKHLPEWQIGKELKLRQIVTETQEEAEALYLSILDGADFEATAESYNNQIVGDGSDLGYLQKQATPIEFDSLFLAEIGEVSPVIKTEFGYHIVRVEDRRPARTRALNEVRDTIARTLEDKKREEIFNQWIDKLRERTEIRINEELLKKYS